MSIESLLEDSIIADFMRDPLLQTQTIRKHDYGGEIGGDDLPLSEEVNSVIIVTAIDRGEFKMGSGIRNLAVEVKIRVNGEADNFDGTLLDNLTDVVRFRLMPSPTVAGAISGREGTFSTPHLRIYGITQGEITQRTDQRLERIRTVPATFIAAQC
jgi:hypothetical protein